MGLDNPLHIAFLVVILLLVFGARRLPEIGRSIGSGMREFKQAVTGEAHDSQQTLPASSSQQQPLPASGPQQPPPAPAQVPAQPPATQAPVAEPVATPAAPPEQPPAS
jgi:sec-independent protein translocase protein TatA